jgi:hypothetical protein
MEISGLIFSPFIVFQRKGMRYGILPNVFPKYNWWGFHFHPY